MIIRYVDISNILSIKNIRLEFGNSGIILIDGWNYDDDTANGAGKTALFNALSFGIYGKFPRKVSISQILREGAKKGCVKVGLEHNGKDWVVERYRPNEVHYFCNGVEQDIQQEEFEAAIGLVYDQFLISMYSAQAESKKLISLNDTGKKDFILQLLNLVAFPTSKKVVDAQIKSVNTQIGSDEKDLAAILAKIEVTEGCLVGDTTEDIEAKIAKCDTSALDAKFKKLRDIPKPDLSKHDKIVEKANKKLSDIVRQELELQNLYANLKKLIAQIKQFEATPVTADLVCPECKTDLSTKEGRVVTLEELKKQRDAHLAEMQQNRDALVDQINNFPSTKQAKEKIQALIIEIKQRRNREMEQYNAATIESNRLAADIAILNARRKSCEDALVRNVSYKRDLEKYNKRKLELELSINTSKSELIILEAISQIFSPTGAPAYVMDSVLDVFNDKITDYVNMIWPNATYQLQSYKENKNKDIKAKFSERLTISGRERSLGALSGGEYKCLSLAIDFAIIDVLETMFATPVNPIIMDEPFEGLDTSNRERVIELLMKLGNQRQIIVIDHASEAKAMFTNIIRIEKTNGISVLA